MTNARRWSAFIAMCSLLIGLIVAPAADAWTYHSASAGQLGAQPAEAVGEAPSHALARCSILSAAKVPQGLPGDMSQLHVRLADCPELPAIDHSAPLPASLALLPFSRAPPSA
jgi:hypothetical protein